VSARCSTAFAALIASALAVSAASAVAQPAREKPRTGAEGIAYQKTTEAAIDSLPKQLKPFYKAHRAEMPSQAMEPEFPAPSAERRFLVDRLLPFPFLELPRSEAALKSKFADKTTGIGRLPWLLQEGYARLVEAMKATDKPKILAESDALASLVVDMQTVVNLTDNFDGQKTGQHGLYVRYVEKLPQYAARELKISPEAAAYLDDPKEYVFSMLLSSYVWIDNVLYLDELAKRGKPGYSEIYFEDFARRAGPILKDRLSRAAVDSGSYWYTAWTAAGRPQLQ
jgi:hypothetical protein